MASSAEHHADRTYSVDELHAYAVSAGYLKEAGDLERYREPRRIWQEAIDHKLPKPPIAVPPPPTRKMICPDCGRRLTSDETKGSECTDCGVRW